MKYLAAASFLALTAAVSVYGYYQSQATFSGPTIPTIELPKLPIAELPKETTIHEKLQGKDSDARAKIRSEEVMKKSGPTIFLYNDIAVRIVSVASTTAGLQVLVRASRHGKPLGFGDGTVEIERINIHNPPTLVEDPAGPIIQTWVDEIDGTTHERRLREDPFAALKEDIGHTVSLIAKESDIIVRGKVGNTVSTFFPDASVESTSVDGYTYDSGSGYSTVHNNTTADDATDNGTSQTLRNSFTGGTSYEILRMIFVFDTTSIPDTDAVSAATASFKPSANGSTANSESVSLVSSAPASDTALATGDYDSYGTTKFATDITMGTWTTGAYEDMALNASGIAAVGITTKTYLGLRTSGDVGNSTPTGTNTAGVYFADRAGTTDDPKLVVTHSAAGGGSVPPDDGLILFE